MRGPTSLAMAVAGALIPAPAAYAGDPVMPSSQVRPGMQCSGYSVFRGTAVERFDVEVLDVVGQNVSGGTATRLLVRVSGEKVDRTGVGPGFSGSPIYCPLPDGTPANAGAISETIGEYGGKTVLATPIEQILGTPVDPPTPASPGRAPRDRAGRSGAPGNARGDRPGPGGGAGTRRLASPMTVRGLSRPVHADLAAAARRRGVGLLQAPPFALGAIPPQRLVPGSAVSVGLSSGDISVGAVGTVAYVDGADVWAFGHAFDGAGARALLLQDAYVSTVVENPVATADGGGTYKLSGAVNDIGTVTYDGLDAVAGRMGPVAPTVPVRVYTRDADRGIEDEMLVRVADETRVGNPIGISGLSFIAPLAVTEAATRALGATPLRLAGQMCFQVVLAELRRPLRFCNRYVSDGTLGGIDGALGNLVALAAGTDAAAALSLFDIYKGRDLHVREVSARLSMSRGQRQAYLRRVVLPARVRRGETVGARMVVRVVRGERRTIRFRWRVPRSLRAGRRQLTFVGPGPDGSDDLFSEILLILGEGDEEVDTEGPRTVGRLARLFRAIDRWDGVRLKGGPRVFRHDVLRIGGRARTTVVVRPARG